jgi:hypothetical protein
MFVAKPPFSLSLTIPFENECTGTHRVGLYYFRDNSLRYVCDVTDVENSIILKNYFPWAIGAPLVIGIRDQARAAINQTLDIFSVQPSDLTPPRQHPAFTMIHILPPPTLVVHEPCYIWAWPRDGARLADSEVLILPNTLRSKYPLKL